MVLRYFSLNVESSRHRRHPGLGGANLEAPERRIIAVIDASLRAVSLCAGGRVGAPGLARRGCAAFAAQRGARWAGIGASGVRAARGRSPLLL